AVRDVAVRGCGWRPSGRTETRAMRIGVVVLAALVLALLGWVGNTSVVDLLLLAYAVPIQFLPLTLAALYWPRANRVGATAALGCGLASCMLLFALKVQLPALYAVLNPADLQIGVLGGIVHVIALVAFTYLGRPMDAAHLERF
ncbi:MAG: hypothetical protein IAG13_13145, partial [Deltaproteobacteria bacterium]|nr:hypothetical protein [Nannocystaceae bacterium]